MVLSRSVKKRLDIMSPDQKALVNLGDLGAWAWDKITTLEAENARLRVQVEGMREIVKAVAKGEPEHGGRLPNGEIYGCIRVSPLELKEQAQAFLSHEPSDMVVQNPEDIIDFFNAKFCQGSKNVLVRREAVRTVLKWLNELALFQALHIPCEPVPELVEAISHLEAAVAQEEKP